MIGFDSDLIGCYQNSNVSLILSVTLEVQITLFDMWVPSLSLVVTRLRDLCILLLLHPV